MSPVILSGPVAPPPPMSAATLQRCILLATTLLALAPAARADAIAKLRAFNAETRSVTAEFTQRVLNERLKEVQSNTGYIALQRPGQFRWVYKTPNQQVLVSDGKVLWLHDPELRQATRRAIGSAMSGTPASLLASDARIESAYKLQNIGEQGGLDWLEGRPKREDSGFVRVRIGMNAAGEPAAMELLDSFGQTIMLKFSKVTRNPKLIPEAFLFEPPPGTDVLSE
ncbi:MAG: outer membrane lipoprotein chaperone LolA [Rhodocyclaceae bacterium]|nr:outer membrane lipoprotein chaperone LolA [Rhodocyclaceae bacterium]